MCFIKMIQIPMLFHSVITITSRERGVSQIIDTSMVCPKACSKNKENIKGPYNWLLLMEIYRWIPLTKGQ